MSRDRFQILFDRSSDPHIIFDATGITDCNDAMIRLLGAPDKSRVLALHPAALSPEFQPDGRRSAEKSAEMDRIARTFGHHRFEWVHRRLDGKGGPRRGGDERRRARQRPRDGSRLARPDGAQAG